MKKDNLDKGKDRQLSDSGKENEEASSASGSSKVIDSNSRTVLVPTPENQLTIEPLQDDVHDSLLADHIIMTGDDLSSDEIQQIQAVIKREADTFKDLDDGEVQIILRSGQDSFLAEGVDLEEASLMQVGEEQEVLIVNSENDQKVLTIFSPQISGQTDGEQQWYLNIVKDLVRFYKCLWNN